MKNPNGYGSITKLSGNRRRPFVVRAAATYDEEGKERREIIGYYRSRPEALLALAEYNKAPTTSVSMTLGQLYDAWKNTRSFTKLSTNTQNNYKAAWNKRLSALADRKVREIKTEDLQEIIDTAEENGNSRSSMEKDKALMTILFDYAMQKDIVYKNYGAFVDLPTLGDKTERDAFTDIEMQKIEQSKVPYADLILVMCYTGFRISEFLSLTAFSYDQVNQTLTGGMKTEAGKDRVIPLHPKIRPIVKKWAEKNGETLFCKDDGTPFKVKHFRENIYYPTLEAIGVRKLTPHCTRHTFATLLDKAGVDPTEIKHLMGHSNYKQSQKYTHTELSRMADAINALQ